MGGGSLNVIVVIPCENLLCSDIFPESQEALHRNKSLFNICPCLTPLHSDGKESLWYCHLANSDCMAVGHPGPGRVIPKWQGSCCWEDDDHFRRRNGFKEAAEKDTHEGSVLRIVQIRASTLSLSGNIWCLLNMYYLHFKHFGADGICTIIVCSPLFPSPPPPVVTQKNMLTCESPHSGSVSLRIQGNSAVPGQKHYTCYFLGTAEQLSPTALVLLSHCQALQQRMATILYSACIVANRYSVMFQVGFKSCLGPVFQFAR